MTKQTEKATPRPWSLEAFHGRLEAGPATIKDVSNSGYADAKLIVRAVNNFDALLEACKDVLDGLKITGLIDTKMAIYKEQLEQAIAQAEKEG